jgi:hypothetical protein
MGTTYELLKITTVAGTFFSVYCAFAETLLLEDLLLVIAIAAAFVATAKEAKKHDKRPAAKGNALEKGIAEGLEKEILSA